MKRLVAAIALTIAAISAWGQSSEIANPDPAVEARLKVIAHELRCLVCQNQTIADSEAPLAVDLRRQVRSMIHDGKSDEEIRGYMVDRYGDFVLYKPRFSFVTAVLWVGPAILIVLGFATLWMMLRRRRDAAPAPPGPERRREIEALLGSEEDRGRAARPRGK